MTLEGRKLQLIEAIINESSETVLRKLERVLKWEGLPASKRKTLYDFASILSKDEADEMWKSIDKCEGCGHPDCLYKTLS